MSGGAIEQLARLHGIGERYHDYRGELRHFSPETKAALLSAMGVDVSSDARARAAIHENETLRWAHMLPPVHVASAGQPCEIEVSIPQHLGAREIAWSITLESGAVRGGTVRMETLTPSERAELDKIDYVRLRLPLPSDLPPGYHRLNARLDSGLDAHARLIVSASKCFEPAVFARGERVWGIAVQLYSLRSEDNWGIGDFHDLTEVIKLAAPLGCSVVGVNPLHAMMPANPAHISPYSPSNREFLNVLYIAVPQVPDFAECEEVRRHVSREEFRSRLAELRAAPNVDYVQVARAKFEALRMCHEWFHHQHLAKDTPRAQDFRRFVQERGEPLRLQALYDALDSHLRLQGPQYWGWPSWPEEYRDPRSAAVNRFARERPGDVEYFLYLQWLAEDQLWSAQRVARECGMSIGLYGDVAVGANPGGSESWSNRELYLQSASITS
jgi:4-alpha-glucanotransferase